MPEDADIARDITRVEGPSGQNVVLVPSKVTEFSKEEDATYGCTCAVVLSTLLGGFLLIVGLMLLFFYLTASTTREKSRVVNNVFIATVSVFGIGAFLLLITIPMYFHLNDHHSSQVERYMNRGDTSERQPVLQEEFFSEDVSAEAFARNFEVYNPTEPESPARGQRRKYPGIQMGSVRTEAFRSAIYNHPSQRNNSSHTTEGGNSSYGHQTRQYQDRYPSSQNNLYHPGRAPPLRTYPGGASPQLSSPGGERSSPSSDTTYLSYYSSGAEGQSGHRY